MPMKQIIQDSVRKHSIQAPWDEFPVFLHMINFFQVELTELSSKHEWSHASILNIHYKYTL